MHRSLLPLILASLGFLLIPFAVGLPLFEWQVSEIVTDFPSTYQVKISPSPWKATLGEALDDGSYILQEIRVIGEGAFCRKENLKFVVKRSQNDEIVERVFNANLKNTSWLFTWGIYELILSGMYILWFVVEYKHHSVSQAVIVIGVAGFIYISLILVWRVLGPQIGYVGISDCYGTITFNARLLKVHYETLIVLFVCILAELGALGVMLRQIIRAVTQGKESAKSAVG
jgi:hypothetical protein